MSISHTTPYPRNGFWGCIAPKALLNLWLAMDEIKAKVVVEQLELPLAVEQFRLDL